MKNYDIMDELVQDWPEQNEAIIKNRQKGCTGVRSSKHKTIDDIGISNQEE